MNYKVLVLDIDGTLTNTEKMVTNRTKQAILSAQKKGITVVLATGRPTFGVHPFIEELQLAEYGGYILSFNGGQIISCESGETIYQKELPKDKIPEIYKESKNLDTVILTYDKNSIVCEQPDDIYVQKEAAINKMPVRQTQDFVKDINYPITKCLVVAEKNHLVNVEVLMKDKFGADLKIYRSEPFFLEIMPQNIDKAYSLSILCKHLGCTSEEMIACGDGYNDLSMIQYAGLGVAMENAQPEVKAIANEITLSNDEEGVAAIIEKYILK